MDDDVARMLADLGAARRDRVSAPEEESHGRAMREDLRAQQAALADYEARQRFILENAPDDNEVAVKLKSWHTEANFDSGEGASGLENRYSGQGHRARLQAEQRNKHRRYDDRSGPESRLSDERRRYLAERGQREASRTPGYIVSASSSTPPRRDRVVGSYDSPRTMPSNANRDFVTGYASRQHAPSSRSAGTVRSGRGRRNNVAERPANRQRAPSPRNAGTVRFGPGGQRQVANGNSSSNASVPKRSVPPPARRSAPTTKPSAVVNAANLMPMIPSMAKSIHAFPVSSVSSSKELERVPADKDQSSSSIKPNLVKTSLSASIHTPTIQQAVVNTALASTEVSALAQSTSGSAARSLAPNLAQASESAQTPVPNRAAASAQAFGSTEAPVIVKTLVEPDPTSIATRTSTQAASASQVATPTTAKTTATVASHRAPSVKKEMASPEISEPARRGFFEYKFFSANDDLLLRQLTLIDRRVAATMHIYDISDDDASLQALADRFEAFALEHLWLLDSGVKLEKDAVFAEDSESEGLKWSECFQK